MKKGYTLVELLVVIVIFAVIGIVAAATMAATLRGTGKSTAITAVRQSIDYAMGSMERQIRGASTITSTCNNTPAQQITFSDQNKNSVTFSCIGINSNGAPASIASGSAVLTSNNVTISDCSFTCVSQNSVPAYVIITITANDLSGKGAPITDTTQITLRSY